MKRFVMLLPALSLVAAMGCAEKKTEVTPEPAKEEKVAEKAPAEEKADEVKLPEMSVEQVDALLSKKDTTVAVFDANGEKTRLEQGVIPGAVLLSSFKDYDAATVLPKDKAAKLVFYCGSTSCTASDTAAKKAITAGYGDVNVLRAGIKGWVDAGKKTAAYTKPAEAKDGAKMGEDKKDDAKEG